MRSPLREKYVSSYVRLNYEVVNFFGSLKVVNCCLYVNIYIQNT